jgi:hypothetical protein
VNPPSAENTKGGVASSKSSGCSVTINYFDSRRERPAARSDKNKSTLP